MRRKRDKPYPSAHTPYSYPKRRRPPPPPNTTPAEAPHQEPPTTRPTPPPAVVVIGLPTDCSVLDLKSRFEIYGPISRMRIDHDAVGFITFRTKSAAESAVSAALDPSFGITLDSKRVQVIWASESEKGREVNDDLGAVNEQRLSSKLLRAERPLSGHGRGGRLNSTIVSYNGSTSTSTSNAPPPPPPPPPAAVLDGAFKGRQIVAYNDLL
ncbi:hypothetical protein Dimus_014955 [Dionaea muscipula]